MWLLVSFFIVFFMLHVAVLLYAVNRFRLKLKYIHDDSHPY